MNKKLIPNTELIRELADYIEAVPQPRFFFGNWFRGLHKLLNLKAPIDCGTTACALGWATTMKSFKDKGLKWAYGDVPSLEGDEGNLDAVAHKIFGITKNVFRRLFVPSDRKTSTQLNEECTPKEWAQHARKIADELDQTQTSTSTLGRAWIGTQTAEAEGSAVRPASLSNS